MAQAPVHVSDSMARRLAELKADDHAEARARLAAIEAAMTPQWQAQMLQRVNGLSKKASAPKGKLPKLYTLMEEVGALRSPHVSCKAGCSACCRTIPVEISDLEARHIAAQTGRRGPRCADLQR